MGQTMPSGAKLMIMELGTTRTVCLEGREEWLLGRTDPGRETRPEICFGSRLVSRLHGWLTDTDGSWFYTDSPENRNGTYHNGRKLTRPRSGKRRFVMLSHGDVLRIGGADPNRGEPEWVTMLFITDGGKWEGVFLHGGAVRLTPSGPEHMAGCYGDCSGAWLRPADGGWTLEWAQTQPRINGRPASGRTPLQEGDRIDVGLCRYVFLGDRLAFCREEWEREG